MSDIHKLIQALKDNIGNLQSVITIKPAKVKSVQDNSCTVVLTSNGMELDKVQFTATEANALGFRVIPKVDTNCLIAEIGLANNSLFLLAVDEMDRIEITVHDMTIIVSDEGIIFNNGDNGGVPISANIASEINDIKSDINNLKSILAGWVPVASDGGAALKALLLSYYGAALEPAVAVELENENVKH